MEAGARNVGIGTMDEPIKFEIQRFDPEENALRRKVELIKSDLEQAESVLRFLQEENDELETAAELIGGELAQLLRTTFLESK